MSLPYLCLVCYPPSMSWLLPKPGPWLRWVRYANMVGLILTTVWLGSLSWAGWHTREEVLHPDEIPFDTVVLQSMIHQGKTVVVDIGAAWCITCRVNRVGVLHRASMQSFLQQHGVVVMHGELTPETNAVLLDFMKQYKRYAVPTTVVLGPKAPQGILLSEVLTSWALRSAIQRASEYLQ